MPPCASACHVPDARSWRSEIPRAPEPPPQLPPTMVRESARDRDVTSARARSVGRSSPCRPAPQAASWSSSSLLHPLQGAGSTLPTTARLRHAALPKGHILTGILKVTKLPVQSTFWRFVNALHLNVSRQILTIMRT